MGEISQFRNIFILILVCGNLAFSLVVNKYMAFDPYGSVHQEMYSDSKTYLDIYFGKPVEGSARYRILTPYLARLIPDKLPFNVFFAPKRHFGAIGIPSLKFAIINFFFLIGSCVFLLYIVQGLGLSYENAILGMMCFFSFFAIGLYSGVPRPEAGYCFFTAFAVFAIQRKYVFWLAVATILGVFLKEQILLVFALVLLAPFELRQKIRLLLFGISPAVVIYFIIRFWLIQTESDPLLTWTFIPFIPEKVSNFLSPMGIRNIVLTFGLLWIPLIYSIAFCDLPKILIRWAWWPAVLFMGNLSFGGLGAVGIDRHLITAFPVVIPIILVGFNHWLKKGQSHIQ